jgi:hypothetical protein
MKKVEYRVIITNKDKKIKIIERLHYKGKYINKLSLLTYKRDFNKNMKSQNQLRVYFNTLLADSGRSDEILHTHDKPS